jgi:DNA-binding LacI/PurR family transcriptional regulator
MSRIGVVQLARIAGVSPSTVSRALAGAPGISACTRARISDLAVQHGFRLNQTARAFRRGQTGTIGLVLPLGHGETQHLSDPFFMSIIGHLADALTERGLELLLSRVIPTDGTWLDRILSSGRIDGAIVIGQSNQSDVIERAARAGAPVVVWGAYRPEFSQITVGTDNIEGGRLAGAHLLSRGRRKLLFVGNPQVPEFADRFSGLSRAVADAGSVAKLDLLPLDLTAAEAEAGMRAHLASHPAPDGVFAASDVIAIGVIRALVAHGLAVPSAVSVVGYDDVSIAQHSQPPLTTIRQDVARGVRHLVDLLLQQLAGEPVQSFRMLPELIVRESS